MKMIASLVLLGLVLAAASAGAVRPRALRVDRSGEAASVPPQDETAAAGATNPIRPSTTTKAFSDPASEVGPYNLVIIILDCSRSFQVPSRSPGVEGKVLAVEALRIVEQFFRAGANQKRRRTDAGDLYYLIAADAASQVIWSGTRAQLAELTPDALARKLAVRAQFAACTDLEAALNEAGTILQRHPEASDAYVLTFSDLLHEPPLKSWRKCAPKSGEPPKGIDWNTLASAHLGFYFVSKEFPYRPDAKWKAEVERRGLQADFFDAAQALTAGLALTPPPPAVYKPTQAEVGVAHARAEGFVQTVVSAVKWFVLLCVMAMASLFGWVAWTRQRGKVARSPQ
jgi:hypothetical protein